MSHFTVAVFTEKGGKTVDELLAKFDEDIQVEQYIEYTKEQLIEKSKKEIAEFASTTYAKYLSDKEAYISNCSNKGHINYLEERFPKELLYTDEEHYQSQIKYYEEEDINENGDVLSTYNPFSKWDWYQVGGRWQGTLKLKDGSIGEIGRKSLLDSDTFYDSTRCDSALVKDIDFDSMEKFSTFAVLLPNGEWYEKGKMGWWACVSDEDEEWSNNYHERFMKNANEEWTLTVVDCHI